MVMQIGAWEALQTLIVVSQSVQLTAAKQRNVLISLKISFFSESSLVRKKAKKVIERV